MHEPDSDLWVFGYGSLVWRPSFPFVERRSAWLSGFTRRFWQGSTDHRGVPGAPGRVVTLIEAAGERCFGVAYRVDRREAPQVLADLDHREKGGYERRVCPLSDRERRRLDALVYLATPENPDFLGEAPLDAIARQVLRSHGPSGANAEYVLELARFLSHEGIEEPHVLDLAARVRERLGERASRAIEPDVADAGSEGPA